MDLPRLSEKEALVIRLLLENPRVDAVGLVALAKGGLKRSSVYTTLSRMGQKGLVAEVSDSPPPPSGPSKRLYRATELGKRIYVGLEQVARSVLG